MPKYAEEILAAVTELQRHPTAEQVFMEMKKEHPSIAIGTVYKHLNALAEEGLLHRITESGSPDRYDRTERHDHLICSRAGKSRTFTCRICRAGSNGRWDAIFSRMILKSGISVPNAGNRKKTTLKEAPNER